MEATALHGWLVVDKPAGLSSAQVVGRVKRLLGLPKGHKIGHGGTLDPLATGVLPIAVGEATKTLGYILESTKTYQFTLCFGTQTTTGDAAGEVVATHPHRPALADITAMLPLFLGPQAQTPPAYSALKVDGKNAYQRARQGEDISAQLASKTRTIEVFSLALDSATPAAGGPPEALTHATFTAHVSKGTYIRTLGEDLAQALGTCGHLSALRRLQAGPFTLAEAVTLEGLDSRLKTGQGPATLLGSVTAGLVDIPVYRGSSAEITALQHGIVPACPPALTPGVWQVLNVQGQLCSLMTVSAPGHWALARNFNLISTGDD